ncbi:MAG: hypothetical protein FWE61_05740 [Micrococcales bacterium]|nr:hypothetical protein [Micrococcales bacterium]
MRYETDEQVADQLHDLDVWEPQSMVTLGAVQRTERRRRAAQVGGLGALGAVVAVAMVAVVVGLGSQPTMVADGVGDPEPTPPVVVAPGQARQAMAALAPDPARALDESSWDSALYWYVKTIHHSTGGFADFTWEQWFDRHDTEWNGRNGGFDERTGYGRSGGFYLGGLWTVDGPPYRGWWPTLAGLPTDPPALEARLREAALTATDIAGNSQPAMKDDPAWQDVELWGQIWQIVQGSPASAELRLALVEVAQGLTSTTVTPGVTDRQGRAGTAISGQLRFLSVGAGGGAPGIGETGYDGRPTVTLIVDPVDGTVLEAQIEYPGVVVYSATFITMGPTSTPPFDVLSTCEHGCSY